MFGNRNEEAHFGIKFFFCFEYMTLRLIDHFLRRFKEIVNYVIHFGNTLKMRMGIKLRNAETLSLFMYTKVLEFGTDCLYMIKKINLYNPT